MGRVQALMHLHEPRFRFIPLPHLRGSLPANCLVSLLRSQAGGKGWGYYAPKDQICGDLCLFIFE